LATEHFAQSIILCLLKRFLVEDTIFVELNQ
jgi:hypothetical protein